MNSKKPYGKRHREDGMDGSSIWYRNGEYHREDGPAVDLADGTREWYLYGVLHREDGPAIECADGTCEWYYNGEEFYVSSLEEFTTEIRLPQIVDLADGTREWYLNGVLHREDGPAVECADGTCEWYYNGEEFYVSSLEEFTTEIRLFQIQEVQES